MMTPRWLGTAEIIADPLFAGASQRWNETYSVTQCLKNKRKITVFEI